MKWEHSDEHVSKGTSCCAGRRCSGSCCCSGNAINPVLAVLGASLFISALTVGGDSWAGADVGLAIGGVGA